MSGGPAIATAARGSPLPVASTVSCSTSTPVWARRGLSGFFCCTAPLIVLFGASPRSPGVPSAKKVRSESPRWGTAPPVTAGPHRPPGDRALPGFTLAPPRRQFSGPGSAHRGRSAQDLSSGSGRTRTPGSGSRPHSRSRLFAKGQAADPLRKQRAGSAPPHTSGQSRGPVASRTGSQFPARVQAPDRPETARFVVGNESAPLERGD
ncbi:hypothetical protein NDU88_002002 [Pleurodeles waltl]|uniref:Uncharacterized protein n=1 Tax=Pleurodeles waltl TaxID=8319 RepID=A0AAV7NCD3_PLEWA|nr:hypothetical protein NDU88_002002 [Pleurodeles waltl]